MQPAVTFSGLRELDRALAAADKDLQKILREDLKEVAAIVAEYARGLAQQKGLVRSGDLIYGIDPFALRNSAGVRSTAIHRGFRYPRRLEFEGRGSNLYGPDATLLPAFALGEGEMLTRAEGLLDRLMVDLAK